MNITHDGANSRFVAANENGELMGEISYQDRDGSLYADHTHTQERYRGRGVAGKLLDAMADYARCKGMKIVPVCSYVVGAFERDPERYRDVMK